MALRLARRADFLTVANQGDVKAERNLFRNPAVQKESLSFLVLILTAVFRWQNAKAGENTIAVNIRREHATAKRVEHNASRGFQAHSRERAEKLDAPGVVPAPEGVERELTEAFLDQVHSWN